MIFKTDKKAEAGCLSLGFIVCASFGYDNRWINA